MNIAERAVIVAAGFGSRLLPITKEIPKPLIKVNGKRIIDTIIDALHDNGIQEIHIVVGHLKELFYELLKKYQGIHFIENPYYQEYNNLSSLFCAREYLENAIVLDGDQIIKNRAILEPYFDASGYCCSWIDQENNGEWILKIEDKKIIGCDRNGKSKGLQLHSISFWSKKDAERLKKHLEEEFLVNRNKSIYWDDIVIFLHPEDYDLKIKKIASRDLIEIDSLSDLTAVDRSYERIANEK